MMSFDFESLNNSDAASLIKEVINHLEDRANQKMIEESIGYFSLSKAKDIENYNKGKSIVAGWPRQKVLREICKYYQLDYDQKTRSFFSIGDNTEEKTTWYVYYYFSTNFERIGRGIISFESNGFAQLSIFHPSDTNIHIHWRGKYITSGQYLFYS